MKLEFLLLATAGHLQFFSMDFLVLANAEKFDFRKKSYQGEFFPQIATGWPDV